MSKSNDFDMQDATVVIIQRGRLSNDILNTNHDID